MHKSNPLIIEHRRLRVRSAKLDTTLEKAHRLLTVSAAVRDELIQNGYPDPEHLEVVHHGPGQGDGVFDRCYPSDSAGLQRGAVHDRGAGGEGEGDNDSDGACRV